MSKISWICLNHSKFTCFMIFALSVNNVYFTIYSLQHFVNINLLKWYETLLTLEHCTWHKLQCKNFFTRLFYSSLQIFSIQFDTVFLFSTLLSFHGSLLCNTLSDSFLRSKYIQSTQCCVFLNNVHHSDIELCELVAHKYLSLNSHDLLSSCHSPQNCTHLFLMILS